jgi:succinate semialdehyde dehydrogenase (EC 1.2.1.16)
VNISDRALFRQQAYINGQWRDADNQETLPVSDPATGQLIGSVPNMATAETQRAIDAAQQALEGWRALPAQQRAQLLRRWFELMLEHQQDLASLMTLEQGKPRGGVAGRDPLRRLLYRMVRRTGQAHQRRHHSLAERR